MDSFTEQRTFSGQFADVAENAWYKPYVEKTYELGLVNGTSTNQFSPDSSITIAQTIALAARIHATYFERKIPTSGGTWYAPSAQYAVENGIIGSSLLTEAGLDALEINRLSFAWILVNALPVNEFQAINTVAEDAIPDLQMSTDGALAVYAMYEAGILTGNDAYGTFTPYSTITRVEVAAVVSRMIDPLLRKTFSIRKLNLSGYLGEWKFSQWPDSGLSIEQSKDSFFLNLTIVQGMGYRLNGTMEPVRLINRGSYFESERFNTLRGTTAVVVLYPGKECLTITCTESGHSDVSLTFSNEICIRR